MNDHHGGDRGGSKGGGGAGDRRRGGGATVTGGAGEVVGEVDWRRLLNGSRVLELLYRLEVMLKGGAGEGGRGECTHVMPKIFAGLPFSYWAAPTEGRR